MYPCIPQISVAGICGPVSILSPFPTNDREPFPLVHKLFNLASAVARRLLQIYSSREDDHSLNALVEQIEQNLTFFRDVYRTEIDTVLIETLRGASSVSWATAALIGKMEWFTPAIGEALLLSANDDGPKWDWPIHRALRKIVSPLPKGARPKEPRIPSQLEEAERMLADFEGLVSSVRETLKELEERSTSELIDEDSIVDLFRLPGDSDCQDPRNFQRGWAELRSAKTEDGRILSADQQRVELVKHYLGKCESGLVEQTLKETISKLRGEYSDQVAEFEQQRVEYLRTLAPLIHRTVLPDDLLPFKAILRHEALTQRVEEDPLWTQLVMGLYGGYTDYGTFETAEEYRRYAKLLSLPDNAREFKGALLNLRDRWGEDDWVSSIAVHLDTSNRFRGMKIPPIFSVNQIVSDSPLSAVLISHLRNGTSGTALREALRELFLQSRDPRVQAECLVALTLLNVDVGKLNDMVDHDPASASIKQIVTNRLGQIRTSLRDPILRVPEELWREDLKLLLTLIDSERWLDVLQALIRTRLAYGGEPMETKSFLERCNPEQRKYLLAEFWVYSLSGNGGEEMVYNAAVALDLIPEISREDLLASLILASSACNLNWREFQTVWVFDSFAGIQAIDREIPHAAFTAIQNVPIESIRHEFGQVAKVYFLKRALPSSDIVKDQIPEFLTFCLQCGLNEENRHRATTAIQR